MKRYYSTHRPVGPGTYPRAGTHEIHNYDERQYVRDAGREVWGYIEYDRELTPEEARSYELVEGGKEEDVKLLGKISGIEAYLFYEEEHRPELRTARELIHAAVAEFAEATGVTLDSTGEPEPTLTLSFTVKRNRRSVTQAEAAVYCNGEYITSFGDNPQLIEPGEKYYGYLAGCWASKTPEAKFIHATLFHKYDDLYHISDGVQKIIDREIERETALAQRRL